MSPALHAGLAHRVGTVELIRVLARLAWAMVSAAATFVVGLASFNSDFASSYPWLVLLALAVIAMSAVILQARKVLPRYDPSTRTRIGWLCQAAVMRILDEFTDLDARTIGVHGFLLRWRVRWRWFPVQRELVRVGQFRLDHNRDSSGIHWTKGKGLIGVAWETGDRQGADLTGLSGLSEKEWTELPRAERWGLKYEEFSRVQDYGAVIAHPIKDDQGRTLGCVSIDLLRADYDSFWASDHVRRAMSDTGITILRTSHPWTDR